MPKTSVTTSGRADVGSHPCVRYDMSPNVSGPHNVCWVLRSRVYNNANWEVPDKQQRSKGCWTRHNISMHLGQQHPAAQCSSDCMRTSAIAEVIPRPVAHSIHIYWPEGFTSRKTYLDCGVTIKSNAPYTKPKRFMNSRSLVSMF